MCIPGPGSATFPSRETFKRDKDVVLVADDPNDPNFIGISCDVTEPQETSNDTAVTDEIYAEFMALLLFLSGGFFSS